MNKYIAENTNVPSLLDCTLRDGSYTNRFQFTAEETAAIACALDKAGIQWIEVGHGVGLGASRKGGNYIAAATDKEYIAAGVKAVTQARIGVFCIPNIATLDDLAMGIDEGLGFVRIGTNVTEIEISKPFIEMAKKHGLFVCANFMKSYAVSPREFAEKVAISGDYGSDIVYLVDSAGSMLPKEIRAYAEEATKTHVSLGFHGHNNLGLAVANSLLCIELGFRLIDVSLQGIGRSSGNPPTELMALLLDRMGIPHGMDIYALLNAGLDLVQPLLSQTGISPIDAISGYAGFHSSFLSLVRMVSYRYGVDPLRLIVELSQRERVNVTAQLVDAIAMEMQEKRPIEPLSHYHLERYFVNEEGL